MNTNINKTVESILLSYQERGIELSLNDGKLKYVAPIGTITGDDIEFLKKHKERIIQFLATHTESKVIVDKENRYKEFPLTDIQFSYLMGQDNSYRYGGTNCKIYSEFEFDELKIDRVQKSWEKVVNTNDMLHAIIDESGIQRILKDYEIPDIEYTDIRQLNDVQQAKYLKDKRDELTVKKYVPGEWPQYTVEITRSSDKYVLHFSLDMLIADFVSVNLIFDEFEEFYYDNKATEVNDERLTFRDIVIFKNNIKNTAEKKLKYEEDKKYWMNKIDSIPGAPVFPVIDRCNEKEVKFEQHLFYLENEAYLKLCDTAQKSKITPSNLILTAYAKTLKDISNTKEFFIDVTMADRPEIHPDINRLVGDFTVALLLEIDDKKYASYKEMALAIQQRLWQNMSHNSFSSAEVLRELSKNTNSEQMVSAVFTSTLGSMDTRNERIGKLVYSISQTPQVLIDCQILEDKGRLRVNWDVRSGVFPEGYIENAFEAFRDNIQTISELSGLENTVESKLPKSVKKIRLETNDTYEEIETTYLYEGFLNSLKKAPDSKALYVNGNEYSYLELSFYVRAVIETLKSKGFKQGNKVAVYLSRGVWQIASVLGILIAGGTYLPLDVHQPKDRAGRILKTSNAEFVIYENSENIEYEITKSIYLKDLSPIESREELIPVKAGIDKAAYVIFTSGSTGTPKGVVISHEAASNTILDINKRYDITSDDKLLNLANLGFDLSVYDIFGAFYAGAELVQVTEEFAKEPSHWHSIIRDVGITVWNSVPAQMKMLVMYMEGENSEPIDNLKLILLSGDWIPTDLPKQIRMYFPNAEPISLGGATEAAIWSIYYPIDVNAFYDRSIPYGKPLANQRFYILDDEFNEVTDWVSGSIYIAGRGLATEYLGDKKLTDSKFIYNSKLKERIYRTGDIGRYMPDGNIEFQGREDFQVKIRGHRVELGEIEAAFSNIEHIKQSKVIFNDGDLTAFLVYDEKYSPDNEDRIRSEIRTLIPEYMVPKKMVAIEYIPLTANGKVDIRKLKEIAELVKPEIKEGIALSSDTEILLGKIWSDILKYSPVYSDDDFFLSGGDSLKAIYLVNNIKSKMGISLSVKDVITAGKLSELSKVIDTTASVDNDNSGEEEFDL